ncbi:MAG: DUF3261 domain-containing protein [Advenella sp.]
MKHNWIPDRSLTGALLGMLLVLLLAGCAATSVLPRQYNEPAQVQAYKLSLLTAPGQTEDSLLIVQPEAGGASRWIQTNALGAPLARLSLRDGQWTTDGFAPPNPRARQLFEAIIATQIPQAQWSAVYPGIDISKTQGSTSAAYAFSRQGQALWSLQLPPARNATGKQQTDTTAAATATGITLPDHSQWNLTSLPARP